MDGKLVVLCDERPTITEHGTRIGNDPDEHKRVINGLDLTSKMMTDSLQSDILFVDWETIIPSNIETLREMSECAFSTDKIPVELMQKNLNKTSFMQNIYYERLLNISDRRPCIDYGFMAMDDFMRGFTNILAKNGVVRVLPTFKSTQIPEINNPRRKLIRAWQDNNNILSRVNNIEPIELLPEVFYEEYGEIYNKATDEYIKIIEAPYFFEKKDNNPKKDDGGR